MTKCVAAALQKACNQLPTDRLFRELGYIWEGDGGDLKVPVMKGYNYNPLLAAPAIRVPLTPAEQREKVLMAQEDAGIQQAQGASPPAAIQGPKKGLKQATLTFGRA
jgi:hypothetical protein